MAKTYDDSSIDLLIGANRVRKRPASMFGSDGLDGARHGVYEIAGNALDEKSAGYGDHLAVVYYKDGSVSIRDYGRGVPMGWNDKPQVQNWNWHVIYNELYGGGKYGDSQEELLAITDWSRFNPLDYNYLLSVGLNGLGAASTQYTSEFFHVKSYINGVCKSRSFRNGVPLVNGEPFDMFSATKEEIRVIPEEICDTDEPNGTFIHWKPDSTVFSNIDIGSSWLQDLFCDIANVAGITVDFYDEASDTHTEYKAGTLADLVKLRGAKKLVCGDDGNPHIFSTSTFDHGVININSSRENPMGTSFCWLCSCDISFGLTKDEVKDACYHNSIKMLSGVQYEAVNDAIRAFMVEHGKRAGVSIKNRDFDRAFCVMVSTYSNYASFRNQTKDSVDDYFIYKVVYDCLFNKLNIEYGKNNKAIKGVVDRVIEEARVRLATQAMQDMARKVNKLKREKAPSKFASCDCYENKEYSLVEYWITEGDSAAGAVKNARDSRFQCVMPIRGKGLNVAKASMERILANKEIREIFAILGTGFDINVKGEKFFNIDDLKVGMIIIATDADEDGYQIRVLLFLMFYYLAPELLRRGLVYIAETPRFHILLTNGESLYALNDVERDKLMEEYSGRISRITRFKGLGEVDADILRFTTVHPDTRHLVQLTVDFSNQVECDLIDALFGKDKYGQRKMILATVLGSDVTDMLEDNALMIGEIEDSDIIDNTEYEEVAV